MSLKSLHRFYGGVITITNNLIYTTAEGIEIAWNLRNRLTIVVGDSATGKSFVYNLLKRKRAIDNFKIY